MVILGGLEIVAAGYLIHKHQQNKKDKARIEEEEAILEEEEYRKRHSRHGHEHRHSSHSRRRHSRERRHSYDGKYEYGRESSRPMTARPAMRPPVPQQVPPMAQQSMRPPPPSMAQVPPPYHTVPTATPQPPQDIKYGWTDEPTPQQQQQQSQPQQDPNYPPTGWPSHWSQSQMPDSGARLQTPNQRGESSRGRGERRAVSASPHVRFAVPRRERSPSFSPPPSYRP